MSKTRNVAQHSKMTAAGSLMCIAACLAVAGCGLQTPPPDTAQAPPGAFGSNGDSDIAALNLSSWAFASARNLRNRPVDAARAVAAVDYLGGALSTGGRWITLSPIVQTQMLQARQQVRATLGIVPNAPSQVVVTSLANYAATLAATGDQAAAGQYLTNPPFTLGVQATEAMLQNMPFLRETNIATQRAAAAAGNGGGPDNGNSR
jgi:hypothetical protein